MLRLFCSLLVLLVGCTHMPNQQTSPDGEYRHDAAIRVQADDGKKVWYEEPSVIPKASIYSMRLRTPGRMDQLAIRTCAREQTLEEAGYSERLVVTLEGLEKTKLYCPIRFLSLEKTKERHSFQLLYPRIDRPDYQLTADIFCNGKWKRNEKASGICHLRENLFASIHFKVPVRVKTDCVPLIPIEDNPELSKTNHRTKEATDIEYKMQLKECLHTFYHIKDGEAQKFLFVTLGYNEILFRSM